MKFSFRLTSCLSGAEKDRMTSFIQQNPGDAVQVFSADLLDEENSLFLLANTIPAGALAGFLVIHHSDPHQSQALTLCPFPDPSLSFGDIRILLEALAKEAAHRFSQKQITWEMDGDRPWTMPYLSGRQHTVLQTEYLLSCTGAHCQKLWNKLQDQTLSPQPCRNPIRLARIHASAYGWPLRASLVYMYHMLSMSGTTGFRLCRHRQTVGLVLLYREGTSVMLCALGILPRFRHRHLALRSVLRMGASLAPGERLRAQVSSSSPAALALYRRLRFKTESTLLYVRL